MVDQGREGIKMALGSLTSYPGRNLFPQFKTVNVGKIIGYNLLFAIKE